MSKKHKTSTKPRAQPVWFNQALIDPTSVFSSPEQVAEHSKLTLEEKLRILRSWEYDATEVSVSLEEGMPGAEVDLLPIIICTILRITPDGFIKYESPTKHHV
ncbi:hypothetical protein [Legionella spiritensis]|uniref:Uncharacterized protein n=1 Tax=Legionella spiritensis TaxID=452 RepID=A0A0W0YYE6_LEGSP|nr:hypothetical protein [Legionella spiritensis]KTD61848.1 hypothetical protein Lspi_2478 [Legionella spiritensis]SNV31493.1 Uncharacterised protein [Legionella spiritensis]